VELISHIAAIHLFKDLPEEHLDNLAMILTDQVFRKRQLIFSEGDQATGFYVVISGCVKIFKRSMDGKEQILHIFGPGAPIGEAAAFNSGKIIEGHTTRRGPTGGIGQSY
jgi:CRP/FNR family transcriptional regulator